MTTIVDTQTEVDNPYEIRNLCSKYVLELTCTEADKEKEKKQRERQSKENKGLLDKIQTLYETAERKKQTDLKEAIRFEMMQLRR